MAGIVTHDTTGPVPDEATVREFQTRLRGDLILSTDPLYDEARRVYNAMIDKHPALIAYCVDVGDVISAVNFARENNMPLAIRGGGHNVAGLSVVDDGLVIDLSRMRGIRVDPKSRTARVEGGCTWGDVDHATHAFGLATPSGIISTTGVAGLTLGGGFGHLSRRYGLSCDNLISADVVTADGNFVTASADENADLFWGLRGGGGNFGVVTSFEFQLHPVSTVLGGPIFYPIEKAEDVMLFYRDFMRDAPDELSAFLGFHITPPAPFIPEHLQNKPMVLIIACYSGSLEDGEASVKPLREFGPPAIDLVGELPYPALNSMFDALLPPGLQHYWKADFIEDLTEEMMDVHLTYGPRVPNFMASMHIYPLSGAVQRKGKDETAFSYRDVEFVHNVIGVDPDPATTPDTIAWVKEYWNALHPYSADGAYVNFMMADEGQARVKATYRENYDRLVALKQKYDPTNLFRMNQNIKPG